MVSRQSPQAAATADILKNLLISHPRYVRAWRVRGERQRGELNQRAVAKVLAQELYDRGDVADPYDETLLSRLKTTVNRAFNGSRFTGQLLEAFIAAFDMDETDQELLWRTFSTTSSVVATIRRPRELGKRQWHRTRSLFEHWYIGQDSSLVRRRTVQCVEALEPSVDSYLYNHEPSATQIEVIHGGRLGRHYEYGEGLVSDDIVLDRPLSTRERASLEYQTLYERGVTVHEVRRPARQRTENVSLHVHFREGYLPSRVWFAVWEDHYLGNYVEQSPVALSDAGSGAHCLDFIEQTVVGFRWE